MDYYPFLDPQEIDENRRRNTPRAKEYAYDIDTGQFKLKNNKMYFVYENEAIKVWIWKLFMTEKFRWVVFPWAYGHKLETLIGQAYTPGYVNSEAERFIREAIDAALSDYIIRLDDIQIHFEDGVLYVSLKAITIYGELETDEITVNL